MPNLIDLHTHLDTLNVLIRLRGKLQHHLVSLSDHIRDDGKIILSVSLYVNFYNDFQALKNLIFHLKKEIQASGESVLLIQTKGDLEKDFKLGIVIHVESARTLKKYEVQLPELFDRGVRGIIPVHFIDNQFGNTCDDPFRRIGLKKRDDGLTDDGVKFTELCNRLGIWLDLTHTTDKTGDDILKIADRVMTSHIGLRDLRDLQRNKPLSFLKMVSQKKGLIGLSPWQHLVGNIEGAYKKHYQMAKEEGLDKNLCIGTDFGVPISTEAKIRSIFDIANQIPDSGFLYENAYRFLKESLPS